jgi:hypothetical protein
MEDEMEFGGPGPESLALGAAALAAGLVREAGALAGAAAALRQVPRQAMFAECAVR